MNSIFAALRTKRKTPVATYPSNFTKRKNQLYDYYSFDSTLRWQKLFCKQILN